MSDQSDLPLELPDGVAMHDEDLFKKICNYLGAEEVLDCPNETIRLRLDVNANNRAVYVTAVEEKGDREDG